MADISITAANVAKVSGDTVIATAGEAITAGQAVYLDTTAKTYKLAINTGATAAAAAGIALNTAATGQPVAYQTSGDITIGGAVVVGTIYLVSGTAGGIAPSPNIVSADYVTLVGVAISTTVLTLNIAPYAVAVP